MSKCPIKALAIVVGIVLGAGIVFTFTPAEAAKLSAADKAAFKRANVACKAEAKGKKVAFLQRRKYVKGCLVEALKDRPNVNVDLMMRAMDTKKLPATQVDSHM